MVLIVCISIYPLYLWAISFSSPLSLSLSLSLLPYISSLFMFGCAGTWSKQRSTPLSAPWIDSSFHQARRTLQTRSWRSFDSARFNCPRSLSPTAHLPRWEISLWRRSNVNQSVLRYHTCRPLSALSSKASERVSPEVQEYWEQVLEGIEKPTAKRLMRHVDPSKPLGLDISNGERAGSRPPVYSYFLEMKKKHPTKVILVRVGEFFETVGIDAVLLVQHCGLNPMVRHRDNFLWSIVLYILIPSFLPIGVLFPNSISFDAHLVIKAISCAFLTLLATGKRRKSSTSWVSTCQSPAHYS